MSYLNEDYLGDGFGSPDFNSTTAKLRSLRLSNASRPNSETEKALVVKSMQLDEQADDHITRKFNYLKSREGMTPAISSSTVIEITMEHLVMLLFVLLVVLVIMQVGCAVAIREILSILRERTNDNGS